MSMLRTFLGAPCVAVGLPAISGCAYTITPPFSVREPAVVYLMNYGRHSALLLPPKDRPDELVEYAFGDWRWFARAREGMLNMLPALFWPSRGTLGRRTWPFADEASVREMPHEAIWAIAVERDDVTALLEQLDARFESQKDTMIYRTDYPMFFVRDKRKYHALYTCNHVVGDWLRELGCHVRGSSSFAIFKVLSPGG